LKAPSFQVQGTRLDIHRKTFVTINKFITENRDSELHKKFPLSVLINDLRESQELIEACNEFPDLGQPGLLKKQRNLTRRTCQECFNTCSVDSSPLHGRLDLWQCSQSDSGSLCHGSNPCEADCLISRTYVTYVYHRKKCFAIVLPFLSFFE
jgi:hypothetical protein